MIGNQSRTAALLRARQDNVPRGVGNTHPIFAARAQGAQLWDIDGNEYVDFAGGNWSASPTPVFRW
jgi:4-aminobutyrate aminotransferase / (S)-3-amino-2-methylpropionate transaminase / 5-aminovalerate transaminase